MSILLTSGLFALGISMGALGMWLYCTRLACLMETRLAHILDAHAPWTEDDYRLAWLQEQARYRTARLQRQEQRGDTDPRLYLTNDPYQTPTLLLAVPAPSASSCAGAAPGAAPGAAVGVPSQQDTPPWELPDEAASADGQNNQHDQPTMSIASRSAPTVPLPGLAKRETARRVWQRGWQRPLPPIPHG